MKKKNFISSVLVYFIALLIPLLLVLQTIQVHKYKTLQSEVKELERKQVELVEENRKLISDISVLSSSDRIEKIAEEELGMHKADTEDIVRVEIKGK